jgi:hypothetical protein
VLILMLNSCVGKLKYWGLLVTILLYIINRRLYISNSGVLFLLFHAIVAVVVFAADTWS